MLDVRRAGAGGPFVGVGAAPRGMVENGDIIAEFCIVSKRSVAARRRHAGLVAVVKSR